MTHNKVAKYSMDIQLALNVATLLTGLSSSERMRAAMQSQCETLYFPLELIHCGALVFSISYITLGR